MKKNYEVVVKAILLSDGQMRKYSARPIMKWCEENEIEYRWEKTGQIGDPLYSFKFTAEDDAMAFKLRWL